MIQADIVDIILRNLIYDEGYIRHVIPFLKSEYFEDAGRRVIYESIVKYLDKYNTRPTKEALIIEIEHDTQVSQDVLDRIIILLNDYHQDSQEKVDREWLVDNTEEFCKKRIILKT